MNSTIKNQKNVQQKLLPRGFTWFLKFKVLFVLLLLGFLTPDLSAQVVDGNPGEWPAILNNAANTKKGFKHDPFNQNGIDNQWTGGSSDKDASPAANWHWVLGNSNDKGDIGNAGAVQLGTKLWFFGDRSSFSGDAQIGFWFFKNNVTPTGTGDRSSPFIGEHSNGDLLIISNFTNGGGHAEPAVYQWQGKTASAPGAPVLVTTADADLTTNSSTFPVPDDGTAPLGFTMFNGENWTFAAKASPNSATYPAPLFFEGWVDLATISSSPCFQAFLLETRNSASINASLQDFVAGSFTGTIPVTANAGYSAGASDPGPVSLASVPPHYYLSTTVNGVLNDPNFTYSWAQDPTTGGSLSAANIANPTFTATTAGSFTWTVTATGQGCVASSPVTRVIAAPATCPVINTTPVCVGGTTTVTITTGEAGNAIPAFTHYTWSIVAPANGASITSSDVTDVTSVNVQAGTASFTIKVRVTYDNTNLAARENCTAVVTVNAGPGPLSLVVTEATLCGNQTKPSLTVCNPAAGTYTLKQTGQTDKVVVHTTGALTFTDLVAGQGGFTIDFTDANGCIGAQSNCTNIVATCPGTTARVTPTAINIEVPEEAPNVIAAPNPFSDKIRFSIKSPASGQGSLELYNIMGQKVKTLYQGHIEKGLQNFEYNVPGTQRANLIYVFRLGNQKVTGKLIGLK